MLIPVLCTVGLAGALLIGPEPAANVSREQHLQQFLQASPGVSISQRAGRISRVYGRTFSGGATAAQSAESFLTDHAGMFGVAAGELVADGPGDPGLHAQPIMYDQVTETYKFTGYFYTQHRDNVPVFRTALKLLVRNDPGFPMVLATVDLRDLGGFRVDAAAVEALPGNASRAAAIVHAEALAMEAGPVRTVILAETMPGKASLWRRIVEKHRLRPRPYEDVALWPYGDHLFTPHWDMVSSMDKARRYGFVQTVDSEASFLRAFERLRRDRIVP